jgi:hypothetical protein
MIQKYSSKLVVLVVLILSSCSATNDLTLPVTQPAPVYINKQISRIGIINRSIPDKKHEAIDAVVSPLL